MRKFYSTAVLAILLSVLSSPVIAAVEDCDVLKGDGGTRGLYGMCVAFWNAEAKQDQSGSQLRSAGENNRFLDKYNKIRDRVGGPEMPGLSPALDCPCWDAELLALMTLEAIPLECGESSGDGGVSILDFALFNDLNLQFMAGTPLGSWPAECFVNASGVIVKAATDEQETLDCRDLLKGLNDIFANADLECDGW